ncbi:hypothetical protein BDR22DRAFT_885728 [Usnea florida]
MASAHSDYRPSTSYENWNNRRSDDPGPLRPQAYPQERSRSARPPRPRTPSRVRPPRPRSPSRVRKPYTSNCARQRWPPSPRVEDETVSLKKELSKEGKPIPVVVEDDGVQMRGTPDQHPIVKDIDDDTESSEDSAPSTPPSSTDNQYDRRYARKPEGETKISRSYDGPKRPSTTPQKSAPVAQEKERGRRDVPRLNTDFARDKSKGDIPPPLERARSPYASGPRPSRPKEQVLFGEATLSPQVMSPRTKYAENHKSHSYYDPRIAKDERSRNLDQIKHDPKSSGRPALATSGRQASAYNTASATYENTREMNGDSERIQRRDTYDHPPRPPPAPLGRHASTTAVYPGVPLSPSIITPHTGNHHGSSDESDASRGSGTHRKGPYELSKRDSSKYSSPHIDEAPRQGHSSRQPTPTPPESAVERRGPATNRASLLSGDFLLGINARLEHDIADARRASPRPSPQPSPLASPRESPTASPHSSPPGTPSTDGHHRRAHTVAGLKNEAQRSRPPSPLSKNSTPGSPRTPAPGIHPVAAESNGRSWPPAPRSRMTTPLPSPPSMVEPEPILRPGINVRSPSPALSTNYRSDENHDERHSVNRHASIAPSAPPPVSAPGPGLAPPSMLRPGFSGRQRSASYTDVRPKLAVATPSYLQPADSLRSSGTRSRPSSPSISSPSDRYRPSNIERPSLSTRAKSHVPGPQPEQDSQRPQRSRSRANSYVPEAYAAVSSSRSSVSALGSSPFDSKQTPSAPSSPSGVVAQPHKPVIIPLCPRPRAVAGYKDWYTLHGCSRFAICSDCSHDVFGARYRHQIIPRAPEPPGDKIICDLNDPWIRLATQITMNENRPDLELLTALAKTTAKQRPCMQDQPIARHHWYWLEDDETRKHIPGFTVCQHCVYSLETIFPVLEEVFYTGHRGEAKERVCSLRADGHNFVQYIDVLDQIAAEARKSHKEPNTSALTRIAKRLTQEPESPKMRTPPHHSSNHYVPRCPRDQMLPNLHWHIHPHIPEFTICPSCYTDVVLPAVNAGHPIARAIDHSPFKLDQGASCHLYSTRMRTVFNEACEDDDFEHLRHTAHKRHLLQQDLWDLCKERERHPDDEEVKERGMALFEEWKRKE